MRIMFIGPIHKSAIVDPIGDWYRSHDELALLHPENPERLRS
jgi:hypothetical protein